MILVDSSVWIEFFRRSPGPAREHLRTQLATDPAVLACCEPVVMEILMGARSDSELAAMSTLVDGLHGLALQPEVDFRRAAEIFRLVRASGRTVRSAVDCLIAAVALRHEVTLWHKDADFAAIAGVVSLDHVDLRADLR